MYEYHRANGQCWTSFCCKTALIGKETFGVAWITYAYGVCRTKIISGNLFNHIKMMNTSSICFELFVKFPLFMFKCFDEEAFKIYWWTPILFLLYYLYFFLNVYDFKFFNDVTHALNTAFLYTVQCATLFIAKWFIYLNWIE